MDSNDLDFIETSAVVFATAIFKLLNGTRDFPEMYNVIATPEDGDTTSLGYTYRATTCGYLILSFYAHSCGDEPSALTFLTAAGKSAVHGWPDKTDYELREYIISLAKTPKPVPELTSSASKVIN